MFNRGDAELGLDARDGMEHGPTVVDRAMPESAGVLLDCKRDGPIAHGHAQF